VINQTLFINAHPFTIVGVAPPGFHSIVAGATEEVFVPLTTKNIITPRWPDLEDFESHWMMVVGRLREPDRQRPAKRQRAMEQQA
jgi:hypothetical protein